jgi:hypothetical protein
MSYIEINVEVAPDTYVLVRKPFGTDKDISFTNALDSAVYEVLFMMRGHLSTGEEK